VRGAILTGKQILGNESARPALGIIELEQKSVEKGQDWYHHFESEERLFLL
jgi:hypothetical protein